MVLNISDKHTGTAATTDPDREGPEPPLSRYPYSTLSRVPSTTVRHLTVVRALLPHDRAGAVAARGHGPRPSAHRQGEQEPPALQRGRAGRRQRAKHRRAELVRRRGSSRSICSLWAMCSSEHCCSFTVAACAPSVVVRISDRRDDVVLGPVLPVRPINSFKPHHAS